ncbi:MAG: hypothetical protein ACRD2W_17745, partial [Acidimicrobiales bacterium]
MKRSIIVMVGGMAVVLMGLFGPSPAQGVGDVENKTPRMVGAGWVAIGDVEDKVHLQVHLPCGGEDVGFNPQ